ncbi:division/cell wall cluster transcriptional repressor MraZ [Legionella sp. CNM-1927-20]|uniref:division/cell wall cluster transcriptional repressor MraZ n=1 Tax=Legionella sp. CNM-1927-20 TaxID=3422221 RepID=UPI00403ABAE2
MFRGINTSTLDGKGRFMVPIRYREVLCAEESSSLVVTIDTELCLLAYPLAQWQIIEKKLQDLPSFDNVARRIQRLLIGHATDVELDNSGRILLPSVLREYAKLDKHIVIIGQGNKFEIWNEMLWQQKREHWLAEKALQLDSLPEEMKNFSL